MSFGIWECFEFCDSHRFADRGLTGWHDFPFKNSTGLHNPLLTLPVPHGFLLPQAHLSGQFSHLVASETRSRNLGLFASSILHFATESRFIFAESFATFCRMILPPLNLTVAMAGISKWLPGWFGLRPTRGFASLT